MKKLIIAIVAAVALSGVALAATETVGGVTWTYSVSGGKAKVDGVQPGTKTNISVPNVLVGNPVTQIASEAFKNQTGLVYVSLPNSVEKIWNSAFMGCTSLERVWLSENLEDIMNYAFYGCSRLELV